MSDEPETFNDTIRNRLSDSQQQAREVLFPTAETEPADAGENEEKKTDG
jgi:hypothetical protein